MVLKYLLTLGVCVSFGIRFSNEGFWEKWSELPVLNSDLLTQPFRGNFELLYKGSLRASGGDDCHFTLPPIIPC